MADSTLTPGAGTERTSPEEWRYRICDADGRCHGVHHRRGDGESKEIWWTDHEGSGYKTTEFPFYGSEQAHEWDPDEPVVIVEGQPARDALDGPNFAVLGTLGTSHLPADDFFELLRGRTLIGWADGDAKGREHMSRVLEKASRVAAEVLDYTWHEAPEDIKGPDAADHPAVRGGDPKALDLLLNDLLSAPRFEPEKPEGLQQRVRLGELLRGGIEPTPQLLDGLLYEGRIHSIASGPGTGKTLLAEWMAIQVMRQGLKVLYLDEENGPKLIAERLEELGADLDTLDDTFHYYQDEITLSEVSLAALLVTVEEVRPALVVFDSFADFLAAAGLEENSNSDCTLWMSRVVQPLKEVGVAVLVLDHVPKSGKGPRGAGSKVAKVDVQWDLEVTLPFDRGRTGEITLKHSKDREAWLPKIVRFSAGGGVFRRSNGTLELRDDDGLTNSQRAALGALAKFGNKGATFGQWRDAAGQAQGTFDKARKHLLKSGRVEQRGQRYFCEVHLGVHPQPGVESTLDSTPSGSQESLESTNYLQNVSTPDEGVPNVYSGVQAQNGVHHTTQGLSPVVVYQGEAAEGSVPDESQFAGWVREELRRSNSGPAKALYRYLEDPDKVRLEHLTKAVLVARDMPTVSWEAYAPIVADVADDPDSHPLACECEGCL